MNKFTFKLEAYWLIVFAVLLPLIGILLMVVIPNVLRAVGVR